MEGSSLLPPLPKTRSTSYSVLKPPLQAETDIEKNQLLLGSDQDPISDEKRLKRIMQSRHYSKKYRLKQLEYIAYLESEVKSLQAEVEINSPRIKFTGHQNSLLREENSSIKEKLSAYAGEVMFKEAQYQELKQERDALKEMYNVIYHRKMSELMQKKNCHGYNYSVLTDQPGVTQFMEDVNQNQDLTNMNSLNSSASSSSFNNFF